MNKQDLIEFLKPFNDDIEIHFKRIGKCSPFVEEITYMPPDEFAPARVIVIYKSVGAVIVG